jgi:aminoacylase
VYYGERVIRWIEVTCTGNTGHGSRFIEKTAAEKLQRLINKFLEYREEQKARLNHECSCLHLGDVTTINLTGLSGGLARNIVPAEFKATFDIRITPKTTIKEFTKLLDSWIKEAEGDDSSSGKVTYEIKNVIFTLIFLFKF